MNLRKNVTFYVCVCLCVSHSMSNSPVCVWVRMCAYLCVRQKEKDVEEFIISFLQAKNIRERTQAG